MKKLLVCFPLIALLTFVSCNHESYDERQERIENEMRKTLVNELVGDWKIDYISIRYLNNSVQDMIGITSDTTLNEFGIIKFGEWVENGALKNYENLGSFAINENLFPVIFSYIGFSSEDRKYISLIEQRDINESDGWKTEMWIYPYYIGLMDNIEIVEINENKFSIKGLNHGINEMLITRI